MFQGHHTEKGNGLFQGHHTEREEKGKGLLQGHHTESLVERGSAPQESRRRSNYLALSLQDSKLSYPLLSVLALAFFLPPTSAATRELLGGWEALAVHLQRGVWIRLHHDYTGFTHVETEQSDVTGLYHGSSYLKLTG